MAEGTAVSRAYTTFGSGTYEGALGAYTVTLALADDGATTPPEEPIALEVIDLTALTYDTPSETPLGLGVYGAACELELRDTSGEIRALIEDAAAQEEVKVTISGADGWSGTLTWTGYPDLPGGTFTLSPLVHRDDTTRFVVRDILSMAEDKSKVRTERAAAVLAGLILATDTDAVLRLPVEPVVSAAAEDNAAKVRTSQPQEWAFSAPQNAYLYRASDVGTIGAGAKLADQIGDLCRMATCVAAVSLRQATPEVQVLPRLSMGAAVVGATRIPAGTAVSPESTLVAACDHPESVTGRTVDVDGTWTADGTVERRYAPASLVAVLPDGSLLSIDPGFAYGLDYWPTLSGSPVAGDSLPGGVGYFLTLTTGAAVSQALGRVAAGTYIGLFLVRAWTVDGAFVPQDPVGSVRLTLVGDGGTTYTYGGSGWATGTNNAAPDPTTDDEGDFVTDWAGGVAAIYPAEVLTTEETPDAGALSIALVGAVDGPTTATVYRCEVYVSDEFGDLVTRLSVPVATGRTAGDDVEIPAPNELVHDDGPATVYAMAVPLDALPDQTTAAAALAAARLAQSSGEDGAPLRVVAAEVPGLVGPDTRVSFDGGGRFTEAMPASFAGGALDFKTGMTRGTWTEIRTDGYPE